MDSHNLETSSYYRAYEAGNMGAWDLSLMHSAMNNMELPAEPLQLLRARKTAAFLVLGSATAMNVDNMAVIDRTLRPGQGDNDSVTIIDYNHYPLRKHQQRIEFIYEWHANYKPTTRASKIPELLYPSYNLAQADMTSLPFADSTMDVVVTDYTLNFLDTINDVDRTLAEASRVLKRGGMLLVAVNGHSGEKDSEHQPDFEARQDVTKAGGLIIHQFPQSSYRSLAQTHGLSLAAAYMTGQDMLCGVFAKDALA